MGLFCACFECIGGLQRLTSKNWWCFLCLLSSLRLFVCHYIKQWFRPWSGKIYTIAVCASFHAVCLIDAHSSRRTCMTEKINYYQKWPETFCLQWTALWSPIYSTFSLRLGWLSKQCPLCGAGGPCTVSMPGRVWWTTLWKVGQCQLCGPRLLSATKWPEELASG